ncbi:MAG: hypothetical protein FJY55_02885 [Betaproteobacteria bacterium]|nr:hypothetical protein [Betaproteobacteria bacterium]
MAENHVAEPFARRRRELVRRAWRFYRGLFGVGAVILAATVGPLLLGWWQAVWPAAIGTAIFAFMLIHFVGVMPMQYRAYAWPYFEGAPLEPPPSARFGRALFRSSAVLDDWAREAGLQPITDFESPDVVSAAGSAPQWYAAQSMLRTVDHLTARAREGSPLHGDLEELQRLLRAAQAAGKRCYLLVMTLGDGTNATVEAIRRGQQP